MPENLDRLTEQLKDRYIVEREIGAGGMATVYLARDLRHRRRSRSRSSGRTLAAALGVDRFLREIELAARLQHPHILAAVRLGRRAAPACLYYVMPFVEGETLRDRLAARGAAAGGRCGAHRRARWRMRSTTRTRTGSSTATSSRRTSC